MIFTTDDAMLLDLNFFRRDQIGFAEKNDETCATELYSLASFSPRKEYDPNKVKRRKRKPIVYIICEGRGMSNIHSLYATHIRRRIFHHSLSFKY